MVTESVIKNVRNYLACLSASGIHPTQAVLFGSFARNEEHQWSDIDVVVIAREFDGQPNRELVKSLWRVTLKADVRIEPIPCGVEEWENNHKRPILDIARQEGVVIYPS